MIKKPWQISSSDVLGSLVLKLITSCKSWIGRSSRQSTMKMRSTQCGRVYCNINVTTTTIWKFCKNHPICWLPSVLLSGGLSWAQVQKWITKQHVEKCIALNCKKKRQAGINGRGTASGRMLRENATKTFLAKFSVKVHWVKSQCSLRKYIKWMFQCSPNKLPLNVSITNFHFSPTKNPLCWGGFPTHQYFHHQVFTNQAVVIVSKQPLWWLTKL